MTDDSEDFSDVLNTDISTENKSESESEPEPKIELEPDTELFSKETAYTHDGEKIADLDPGTEEQRDEQLNKIITERKETDDRIAPPMKPKKKKSQDEQDKELDELLENPTVERIKVAYNDSIQDRFDKIWYEFLSSTKYTGDDRQHFQQALGKNTNYFTPANTNIQYLVQSENKYVDQIITMPARDSAMLVVDYIDVINIAMLDKQKKVDYLLLGYQITNDYEMAKLSIKEGLLKVMRDHPITNAYADQIEDKIIVGIVNYDINKQISQLNSTDIPKFRRIEGIISRYDEEKSIVINSTVYVCAAGHENYSLGHIRLVKCGRSDCKSPIVTEDIGKQIRDDFIYITIQQRYDRLADNSREPPELNVLIQGTEFVENTLDRIGNGLYIAVNGLVTIAERSKSTPNISLIEMEASSIEVLPNQNLFEDDPIYDKLVSREISRDEQQAHFEKMIRSVAPNLENVNVEKLGVLLALAGTDTKRLETNRIRGNVNVAFIGDSSTGKTEFLKYAVDVSPRSSYNIGEQTSIVGLLGGIDHREVMRKGVKITKKVVSLGAFTLCDGGILALDEIDKRKPDDYNKFFPTMDDWQTINITKAGLSKTLNANCSVFVAANPTTNRGKYDESISIFDQTNFLESHLSRLDLIFIMTDQKTEDEREMMWKKKNEMYSRIMTEDEYIAESADKSYIIRQRRAADELMNEYYSPYYMRRELMFLKKNYHPKIKPKTAPYDQIMAFWNKMNTKNIYPAIAGQDVINVNNNLFIPAVDDRKINTLFRLTEACARLNRRNEPSIVDAQYAIDILKYTLGRMIPKAHRFINSEKMVEKLVKGLIAPVIKHHHEELDRRLKQRRKAYRSFLRVMHNTISTKCDICKGSGKDIELMNKLPGAKRDALDCGNCFGRGFNYVSFRYYILDEIGSKDPDITSTDVVDIFNALLKSSIVVPLQDKEFYYGINERVSLLDPSIHNLLNIDLFVDQNEGQQQ